MLVLHSEQVLAHAGSVELTGGRFVPCFENPRRAEAIRTALAAGGHELRSLDECAADATLAEDGASLDARIERVHDPRLVAFVRGAYAAWVEEVGEERDALPVCTPTRGMRRIEPESVLGRLGYWCFDSGTPVTAGTWTSARASVDVAFTAYRAATAGGAGRAFALCRPPGHHAGSDFYGGYCYLNASAIIAQAARDDGAERVAVLDVDDHHGNGTQQIFEDRSDVLTLSLHGDPKTSYPYFSGFADEVGTGPGEGFNSNYPLARGAGWNEFERALDLAIARLDAFGPDVVVVPLGVDTYADDPIGARVALRGDDYRRLGSKLRAGLGDRPVVLVMEGGYALEAIGGCVADVLAGFEDA